MNMDGIQPAGTALLICGGAPGGCCDTACSAASSALEDAGYRTVTVHPIGMNIAHCTGCQSCSSAGRCVISDDMDEIYRLFGTCDVVVMATPLRFSGPSSMLKLVMDRLQIYWENSGRPRPARMVMLSTSGSSEPTFAPLRSIMRAFCITMGMEWSGEIYIPGTDGDRSGVRDLAYSQISGLILSGAI